VPPLLIVGGGLFGSQAAALARQRGIDAIVFDPGLAEAASPVAAGLFKEDWLGGKLREHARRVLPVLEQLYGIRHISLTHDDGCREPFLFVPPTAILEPEPVRELVSAVGDGWLEAGGRRYEGLVYVAAGIWSEQLVPGLGVYGKAGAAFTFAGERPGRIRPLAWGRQTIAFVRDPGTTHFSDGTAERDYGPEQDRQTLLNAAELGLTEPPLRRLWGRRPYVRGGLLFLRLGRRIWVATGGRKMGTVLGAACASRLLEEMNS
jgi:glycine/D-amino acid oxidase-like deaminating enzyme